ncbi:substrate-binding periplasmic protein [Falseniella ignava]|uniref:Solute-binding protein family 3/N-terminal domain-containing protein n=1 Tax=Falseniella ignava CCUG 37419 TaxID=883112 RepID=K1MIT5_9LACT|nr:transporter substrate-binding domain-containing protein [Falseniella ignava]EKB55769.1 hypothetical protein HMPREF9707_00956 [Falseniella ignava CCUG 37419]
MKTCKKLVRIVMFLSLIFGFVFSPGIYVQAEEQKVVTLGALGNHPPFNFTDEEGKLVGYEVDVWEEIAKRNNFKLEYQTATFDGLFQMLDQGKIDTILSQISITPDREEKYDFTETYMYSPGGWFIREDAEEVKSFEDLHGKKVAIVPGGADEKMYEKNDPDKKIEVVPFKDNQVGIQAVAEGKIDATGTSIPGGAYLLKENPDLKLKISGYNGITEHNAFPMNKDRDDDLVEVVSNTLKEMKEDGTLKKLAEKWFGIDVTVEDQTE